MPSQGAGNPGSWGESCGGPREAQVRALARQLTPQAKASTATPLPRRFVYAFTCCSLFEFIMCKHGRERRARRFVVKRARAMKRTGCVSGLLLAGVLSCCSSALASSGGAGVSGQRAPRKVVATRSSAAVFTRTLRKGQAGTDIKALQTWLSDVGYKVPATGYFGAITKLAVRRFQLAHRLYPASGSVGNRTSSALRAAVLTAVKGQPILAADENPAGSDPIPGFKIERDDMGVDASARPGAGIYAPVASRLVQVMQDWYAGEPLLLFKFIAPPAGAVSNYWYVAEQIDPVTTTIGTTFQAGQRVASFASSGTDIEIGWGSPTSNARTLADVTDPGAADPPAGSTTIWGESFKKVFGIK